MGLQKPVALTKCMRGNSRGARMNDAAMQNSQINRGNPKPSQQRSAPTPVASSKLGRPQSNMQDSQGRKSDEEGSDSPHPYQQGLDETVNKKAAQPAGSLRSVPHLTDRAAGINSSNNKLPLKQQGRGLGTLNLTVKTFERKNKPFTGSSVGMKQNQQRNNISPIDISQDQHSDGWDAPSTPPHASNTVQTGPAPLRQTTLLNLPQNGSRNRRFCRQHHHLATPGMPNNGNTCYLNSVLQLLYSLPVFSKHLMELGLSSPTKPGDSNIPTAPQAQEQQQQQQQNQSISKLTEASHAGSNTTVSAMPDHLQPAKVGAALPEACLTRALASCLSDLQAAARHNLSGSGQRIDSVNPRKVQLALRPDAHTNWRSKLQQDAHELLVALLGQMQAELCTTQLKLKGPTSVPSPDIRQTTEPASHPGVVASTEHSCAPAVGSECSKAPACIADPQDNDFIPIEQEAQQEPANEGIEPNITDKVQPVIMTMPVSEAVCPGIKTFNGCLQRTYVCRECGHESYVHEQFSHLSVQLPEQSPSLFESGSATPLLDLLHAHFQEEEVRKSCDHCKQDSAIHKQRLEMTRMPIVLAVHVKRFAYEFNKDGQHRTHKLKQRIQLPQSLLATLDLGEWCVPEAPIPKLLLTHLQEAVAGLPPGLLASDEHLRATTRQANAGVQHTCSKEGISPTADKENREATACSAEDEDHTVGATQVASGLSSNGASSGLAQLSRMPFPISAKNHMGASTRLGKVSDGTQNSSGINGLTSCGMHTNLSMQSNECNMAAVVGLSTGKHSTGASVFGNTDYSCQLMESSQEDNNVLPRAGMQQQYSGKLVRLDKLLGGGKSTTPGIPKGNATYQTLNGCQSEPRPQKLPRLSPENFMGQAALYSDSYSGWDQFEDDRERKRQRQGDRFESGEAADRDDSGNSMVAESNGHQTNYQINMNQVGDYVDDDEALAQAIAASLEDQGIQQEMACDTSTGNGDDTEPANAHIAPREADLLTCNAQPRSASPNSPPHYKPTAEELAAEFKLSSPSRKRKKYKPGKDPEVVITKVAKSNAANDPSAITAIQAVGARSAPPKAYSCRQTNSHGSQQDEHGHHQPPLSAPVKQRPNNFECTSPPTARKSKIDILFEKASDDDDCVVETNNAPVESLPLAIFQNVQGNDTHEIVVLDDEQDDADADLQRAIELSKQDAQRSGDVHMDAQEQQEMQRALEQSRQEAEGIAAVDALNLLTQDVPEPQAGSEPDDIILDVVQSGGSDQETATEEPLGKLLEVTLIEDGDATNSIHAPTTCQPVASACTVSSPMKVCSTNQHDSRKMQRTNTTCKQTTTTLPPSQLPYAPRGLLAEAAHYRLHGVVSHRGSGPHMGHYVAHACLPLPLQAEKQDCTDQATNIVHSGTAGTDHAQAVRPCDGSPLADMADKATDKPSHAVATHDASGTVSEHQHNTASQYAKNWQWWRYDDEYVEAVSKEDALQEIEALGYLIFLVAHPPTNSCVAAA